MAKTSKSRRPSMKFEEVTTKADTEDSHSSPPVGTKGPPLCTERLHPLPQRSTQPTTASSPRSACAKHPAPDAVDLRTQIATGFSEIMEELRSVREEIRVVREEVKLVRSEVGSVITMKKRLGDNLTVEAADRKEKREKTEMGTVKTRMETLGDNLMANVTDWNVERKESKMETIITRKEEMLEDNLTENVTDRNKETEESEMGMERTIGNKVATGKQEAPEPWCFICKTDIELRPCDHEQCFKSYHADCLWKVDMNEDDFLRDEGNWRCAWHYCTHCRRSSDFRCYTCPKAVCRHCLPIADFLPVKKDYGFCDKCLKLAFLIEGNKDCDSDGNSMDFRDQQTEEGLFMEYYMITQGREGFKLGDLLAAENQRNNQKSKSRSDLKEFDEEETSDGDSLENRHRGKKRRKESKFMTKKCKKLEFVSWASKPLMEFLAIIGKSDKEVLSLREVASIIEDYVKENRLLHPDKKRMITCDERLQALFDKKTLSKDKVSDYLCGHFAGNIDDSDKVELPDDTNHRSLDAPKSFSDVKANKRQKATMENDLAVPPADSRFAAIVVENMKLVYLKRIWLKERVVLPAESFKEKVTGSFVRIKLNSDGSTTRKSHQLLQVTGVKDVTDRETVSEAILLLSPNPQEVPISLLADGEITTEECEELRLKMLAGELKRPTVGELQKKANLLHEDITLFRIKKELSLLKNVIEHASEKGWRTKLFECFDRRKILQSPTEVAKMIEAIPTVIPELDSTANSGNVAASMA